MLIAGLFIGFRRDVSTGIRRLARISAFGASADLSREESEQVVSSEITAVASTTTTEAAASAQQPTAVPYPGATSTAHALAVLQSTLYKTPLTQDPNSQWARFWVWAWVFERIYRIIYGQQIRILQAANAQHVTRQLVVECHRESRRRGNQQPFEQFLSFMTTSFQLLKPADNQTFEITVLGRQVLAYMITEGLPSEKFW
jgi:hypothetical protein